MSTRLRAARLDAGLTQAQLAARAGVATRTVTAIEQGGRCLQATKRRLCRALGIPWEQRARLWP